MTTPRHNADLFKAIADGYLIEWRPDGEEWCPARLIDLQDHPDESFRLKTVDYETRTFCFFHEDGEPRVAVVSKDNQENDPRELWPNFHSWLTFWRTDSVPAHRGKKHVHAGAIKAWADGAKLRWKPVHGSHDWRCEGTNGMRPRFDTGYVYEVAPKVVRSRRALTKPSWDGPAIVSVVMEGACMTPEEFQAARGDDFIAWIDTTWQTHEVPGGAT